MTSEATLLRNVHGCLINLPGGCSLRHKELRPPLNKKLFPVDRPIGFKRADLNFFFLMIFFSKELIDELAGIYEIVNDFVSILAITQRLLCGHMSAQ